MRDEGDFADRGRERPGQNGERRGVGPRQVLIGAVVVVLVAFAIANFNRVEVNFLLFTTEARVVTVIAVSALLGFVVGYFAGRPRRAERRRAQKDRD